MGRDGTNIGQKKITALRDNSNYFRMRLIDMGLHVLGHYDSPIMPVMLYNPTKIAVLTESFTTIKTDQPYDEVVKDLDGQKQTS